MAASARPKTAAAMAAEFEKRLLRLDAALLAGDKEAAAEAMRAVNTLAPPVKPRQQREECTLDEDELVLRHLRRILETARKDGIAAAQKLEERGTKPPLEQSAAVIDKILALFPAQEKPLPAAPVRVQTKMKTRPDLAVSFKNVADYVYSRKKKLAAGRSRVTNDFVKANMGRMSAAGKEALTRVIQFIGNGRVPLEWTELRTLLTTSRGVALGKDDGGIRPIGISDVFLQIACGVIARKVAPAAAPYCGGNFAVGTKGGTEALSHTIRALLESDPSLLAISLDVQNAFNTLCRAGLLSSLFEISEEKPESDELQVLTRLGVFLYGAPTEPRPSTHASSPVQSRL